MTEYVHLVDSEQVQSAAVSMLGAAAEMQRATVEFTIALQRNRMFMDDWLQRFQDAIEAAGGNKT